MIYDVKSVSMVDYPGKIAMTLFIGGCNFRCPYCHNSQLIKPKNARYTNENVISYLNKRRKLIDGVCITGGEPTLWNGLRSLMAVIKSSGFPVKVDTNGSRPDVLRNLINDGLINYIAMDIKAPIDEYSRYGASKSDIDNVIKSVEIIMSSNIEYEFRTTVHQKLLDLKDFDAIGKWLYGAKRYVLQGYIYSDGVLDPVFCGMEPCDKQFLNEVRYRVRGYFGEVKII